MNKPIAVAFYVLISAFALAFVNGVLPIARITLNVLDEDNSPVVDAEVRATFQNPILDPKNWGTGRDNKIETTKTDGRGAATLEGHSDGELGGAVHKQGYYSGWWTPCKFKANSNGKWLPWDPIVNVVMRKIINPIPMYVRRLQTEMPVADQPTGFDLVEADWVAPYGKGKKGDFVFSINRQFVGRKDYEAGITLTFSNRGDGLRVATKQTNSASELKLPRIAPEDGYAPDMTTSIGVGPGRERHEDAKADRNYFFRVRTVLDQTNHPASALYGKIDGDIRLDAINSKTCILLFTYYLNPTPNDRNVEFDPKRNLFTNLKPDERVTEP